VDAVKRKRVAQWQKWAEAVKRKRAWEVWWERVPKAVVRMHSNVCVLGLYHCLIVVDIQLLFHVKLSFFVKILLKKKTSCFDGVVLHVLLSFH
jgi:hypothetical protein